MRRAAWVILPVMLALFAWGLAKLFQLSQHYGSLYPPYSSLRADPLGTRALFESLDGLADTHRHFGRIETLPAEPGTTWFWLGCDEESWRFTPDEFRTLEDFMANGGRLVMALAPTLRLGWPGTTGTSTNVTVRRVGRRPGKEGGYRIRRPLQERWAVGIKEADLPKDADGRPQPDVARLVPPLPLPEELKCYSALFFEPATNVWRTIYLRGTDQPVVIERQWGLGSLVLCVDSYPFSNQALSEDRQPRLLAWMLGPSRRAVFDEAHLGLAESPGLGGLLRRYRLTALVGVAVVLGGLFIWRHSARLLPPVEEEDPRQRAGTLVQGREAAAGFVNLLRRHIPHRELLAVCIEQWRRDCARRVPSERLAAMQQLIDRINAHPELQSRPVEIYRRFCEILARRPGPEAGLGGPVNVATGTRETR